jgi:HprK-related kinase A
MEKADLVLKIGPFNVRLSSNIGSVRRGVNELYQDFPRLNQNQFCDFYIKVCASSGWRFFFRKQALFSFDQIEPFKPLPISQALHFFEWGLNWCISGYSHQYLIIHAAVIEKNGYALIMPGTPGSGKSTLCAALIQKGWRLLSDELTLINCLTGFISPIPRPVSLKNESIHLISDTFPQTIFSPVVHDTLKGSVSLLKPPSESVSRADEVAIPALVVFPKYKNQTDMEIRELPRSEAFMKLADLSFNYSVLGAEGFTVLANMVDHCRAFDFTYDGNFEEASNCFEELFKEASCE